MNRLECAEMELERYRAELRRPDVARLLEGAKSFNVLFGPDGRAERVTVERREAPTATGPGPWDVVQLADGTFGIPAAARLREAHEGRKSA